MRTIKISAKSTALLGVLCAVNVLLMLLGSVFSLVDIICVGICGVVTTLAIVEAGHKPALVMFFATSVLAFLVLPSKLPALMYFALGGWYPLAKRAIEYKLGAKRALAWALKLVICNLALCAAVLAAVLLLSLPTENPVYYLGFAAIGNFAFVLYDILLTRLVTLYIFKIKKK